MNRVSQFLSVAVFLSGLSIVACSSDSGGGAAPGCASNPFQCPIGKTCWVVDTALNYACLNSGGGKIGDSCKNEDGLPSCGDGLTCFQGTDAGSGVCTPFCDSSHPCPNGEQCVRAQIQSTTGAKGAVTNVCNPPVVLTDAGSDGSDGATDGGADAPADGAQGDAPNDAPGQ
jgi:hypothetical protein